MLAAANDHPSFYDVTPKERSPRCVTSNFQTEDLYEKLLRGKTLVFRNARILTMRGREILDKHDVLVRDGIVEAVTLTGQALPDGATIVDATGKTLLPGLSDVHGHPFVANCAKAFAGLVEDGGDGSAYVLPYDLQMFLQLACGVTQLDVMAGCPDTLWMRDAIRDGTLIGPRMTVGSPLIDGYPPLHAANMSYLVGDIEGGIRAGEEVVTRGFDFAKPYSNLGAEAFEGLMRACDRNGIRAVGHVPRAVGVEAAIRRGQRGIAHCAELFYNKEGAARSDRDRRDRLIDLLVSSGTWLHATVSVHQRMDWICNGGKFYPPDDDYLNPLFRAIWDENAPLIQSWRKQPNPIYRDAYNLTRMWTDAVRRSGAKVLTGTDFSTPHLVEGFSLHEELQRLVDDCGFDPHEALIACTRTAAEYHGEDAKEGTIVPGATARLLLLNGNPLADIRATRNVDAVFVGQNLLRTDAIRTGLGRVRAAYAAMPPARQKLPDNHVYIRRDET
ncbi:MAG: amidohydrolase family protein [Proteobacteria bacterium]|nr:amidohydrolase family protein [Pseudomonadota bacterium]